MSYWFSLGGVTPYGTVYEGDMRPGDRAATDVEVAAWKASFPTMPQTLQIVSTGIPELNGIYPLDSESLQNMNAVASYIAINGKFPSGTSTLPWPDSGSPLHTFSSPAEFLDFASAFAEYVTQYTMYLQGAGAQPSQPVTIP